MIEMQAHKDHLRAEFAMSIRRLEMNLEDMRAKNAVYLRELAKKTAEAQAARAELRKSNIVILRFQGRELLRKSIIRRTVKLLAYMFARSSRESAPRRAAPPFQTRQYSQIRA